jgi:glutathione S-transferase
MSAPMKPYSHPFSSYCRKVLIALYESATPFEVRLLAPEEPEIGAEFATLWPLQRMPLLVDGTKDPHGVMEAKELLETSYAWLDGVMARRQWAAPDRD